MRRAMTAKRPERAQRRKPSGEISLQNLQHRVPLHPGKIRRAAREILRALDLEGFDLSITVVDDPAITLLNRRYFHRNRPTNVISFPMAAAETDPPSMKILGDVVISAETARREAFGAGMKEEEEILFLLLHGVLHLAGYDHEKSLAGKKEMEAKERELFRLLSARLSPE